MAAPALKIIYGVTLDGTETVKWTDSGGAKSVTLDAGTYWVHDDSTFTDYPSLLQHITTKMNAAAAGGYVFQFGESVPTATGGTFGYGLTLSTVNPALAWTWDASGTINTNELLGWKVTGGTLAAVSGQVPSPYSHRGVWRSPESPTTFTGVPHQIITPSTEYTERTDAYFFDQGSRLLRMVECQWIPSAHIFADRADYQAHADTGQVPLTDDNNALEYLWQWMRDGGKGVLVWYADGDDFDLLVDGGGEYEVVRLVNPEQMRSLGKCIEMQRMGGSFYRVMLDLVRADTTNSNLRI